jgi:dolichyl-diphosphooligosaccharide--protein glycosyltransferase
LGGLSLIIPTIFLVSSIFVQKISRDETKIRNSLFLLISLIIIGSFLIVLNEESNLLPLPSFRYLNAINPFLTTTDPLVDSVAEHASTSIDLSFLFHSVWMIFAGLGIWFILSKKISQTFVANDMKAFVIIIGISGVYISSSFIRLEVFASISLIILSSIALSILTKNIFKIKFSGIKNYLFKISYVVIILFLFTLPLVFPENSNWISNADTPPIILTGATPSPPTNDWLETLEWIKLNTPENAVIASWWDYGYWITTLSERTTIVDNATLSTTQIQKMANMFMGTPNDSWNILKEMNADYVLVFLSAQKINDNLDDKLYVLGGGGDESKVLWFARIAELPAEKYLKSDGITGTNYFYEQTMLGKMIPFTSVVYYNPNTQENSAIYKHGFVEIVSKDIKYDSDNDPLKLVYTSPSFMNEKQGPMQVVLIYEVNKNYIPIEPLT